MEMQADTCIIGSFKMRGGLYIMIILATIGFDS